MYEKIYKGENVLGFLAWGLILNVYLSGLFFIVFAAIKPKDAPKTRMGLKQRAAGVAILILLPYFGALISCLALIVLMGCGFDYEKFTNHIKPNS